MLGGSGFMGVALGSVLPAGGLAPLVAGLPSVTVPLLIPLLLIATGQLGLNPVAVVALIGAACPIPGRSVCLRRCWHSPACWAGGSA